MRLPIVLLSLSACTFEERTFSRPFDCANKPLAGDALERISIRGATIDANSQAALSGVTLTLTDDAESTIDGPITTSAGGAYALSTQTGGRAIDRLYVKGEKADYLTTYQSNPFPLSNDLTLAVPLISLANAGDLASMGVPLDPTKGVLALNVFDCNGDRVGGARVSSTPAGLPVYFDGVFPNTQRTDTDDFGVAMIGNLPPELVTLSVTVGNVTYPDRSFKIRLGGIVQNDVSPFSQ